MKQTNDANDSLVGKVYPEKKLETPFFLKAPYRKGVFYFMQQSLLNVTKFLLYYVQYFLKIHLWNFMSSNSNFLLNFDISLFKKTP